MKIHTPPMKFAEGKEQEFAKGLAANQDPYGNAVYRYASEWATRMEARMDRPLVTLREQVEFMVANAGPCSNEADDEGITGFMYGCAVSILANAWLYGEALRRWHNGAVQIGGEGDAASASGGVLNPSLLRVG